MLSIPSVASRTWLGAGKVVALHSHCAPSSFCSTCCTQSQFAALYAVSQHARISAQTSSRLRVPELFGHLGVDTVDLVFNFLADNAGDVIDLLVVGASRVGNGHRHLAPNPARVRMQHDNPIGQSN